MGYSSRINAKTNKSRTTLSLFIDSNVQNTQVGVEFSGRELYTQVGV